MTTVNCGATHLREAGDIHGDPDRLRLSLFAQQLLLKRKQGTLQHIFDRITHQWRVRRARNVFQLSAIAPLSDAEEWPLDIAAAELQDLVDYLQELDVGEAMLEHLKTQADHILEGLPALLHMMQERQKKLAARQYLLNNLGMTACAQASCHSRGKRA